MATIYVWLLLMIVGGIGGILICSLFQGHEVFTGYGVLLGMIVALLSGIFFQLILIHQDSNK